NPDDLDGYLAPLRQRRLPGGPAQPLSAQAEVEELWFLGLRRSAGVMLDELSTAARGLPGFDSWFEPRLHRLFDDGLLRSAAGRVALTPRGRLLSNQVFAEILGFVAAAPSD